MLLVYLIGASVNFSVQRQIKKKLQDSISTRISYLAKEINNDIQHLKTQQYQLKTNESMKKLLLFSDLNNMSVFVPLLKDIYNYLHVIYNSSLYNDEVGVYLSRVDRSLTTGSFFKQSDDLDEKLLDDKSFVV
jgi:hypothetical protein